MVDSNTNPSQDGAAAGSSREEIGSELDEPQWSVVSFEKHEAANLTYWDAAAKMNELDSNGIVGLCIVTDDAAGRMSD
jgi:hypothetical protein